MKGRKLRLAHRRRREGRTDYKQRLRLLKSGSPRLVIRRSSAGMMCQVMEYGRDGDKSLASAGPRNLRKEGWKANTGNIPAAYLIGYMCGRAARKKGVSEAVLDIGLHTSTKGSRIYACMKGFIDAGVPVPHSEGVLPPEDRLKGTHIEAHASGMKGADAARYAREFSGYAKAGIDPGSLAAHFEETRKKLGK
jgi:large subunit ribosomal protein L18